MHGHRPACDCCERRVTCIHPPFQYPAGLAPRHAHSGAEADGIGRKEHTVAFEAPLVQNHQAVPAVLRLDLPPPFSPLLLHVYTQPPWILHQCPAPALEESRFRF